MALLDLKDYVNAANIRASDSPYTVVLKLQAVLDSVPSQLLSDHELEAAFRKSFRLTKFSGAYLQYGRNVEAMVRQQLQEIRHD